MIAVTADDDDLYSLGMTEQSLLRKGLVRTLLLVKHMQKPLCIKISIEEYRILFYGLCDQTGVGVENPH